MNLFIIGNGFDLQHNLKTKYVDFGEYLYRRYVDPLYQPSQDGFENEIANIIEETGFHPFDLSEEKDRDDIPTQRVQDKDAVLFLLWIISNYTLGSAGWSDLENSLGKIYFESVFDDYGIDERDEDGDPDVWKISGFNVVYSHLWIQAFRQLKEYLGAWIQSVQTDPISRPKREDVFENLFSREQSYFINFNYTSTLETVYGQTNVCHIHGVADDPSTIIFGHADPSNKYRDEELPLDNPALGAENNLAEIKTITRKEFQFSKLEKIDFQNVRNIFLYGFSVGESDQKYVKWIADKVDSSVMWHIIGRVKEEPDENDITESQRIRDKLLDLAVPNVDVIWYNKNIKNISL